MKRLAIVSRSLALVLALGLLGYLGFVNTVPFSLSRSYAAGSKHITALGPANRLIVASGYIKQIDNLVYFNADMPFVFDHARTQLVFRNPSPSQEVDLGFRDDQTWHYNTQIISAPFIDAIGWPAVGSGPYLYQKSPTYNSPAELLDHPPTDKVIGTYDYDNSGLDQAKVSLPDYQPSKNQTIINTPLRGKTTLYLYLNGEPFDLALTKRDLNWYNDQDVATVKVYKGSDVVYTATMADDGDTSADHKLGAPITAEIKNPGPGNPEPGVYKVVIDQPGDSVITQISTNLHKIVFAGPLYPVSNNAVYGDVAPATTANNLTTNALTVSAVTFHQAPVSVILNGQSHSLASTQQKLVMKATPGAGGLSTLTLPTSDVTLSGDGYFAFTADQFFAPTPYHILPLADAADVNQVDYILTDYHVPKALGDGWQEATTDFDLTGAVIQKGQLSWLVSAPGLAGNHGALDIKSVAVELSKEGWWK